MRLFIGNCGTDTFMSVRTTLGDRVVPIIAALAKVN